MKSSLCRGVKSNNSFLSLPEGEKLTLGCRRGGGEKEGNAQKLISTVFDTVTAKVAVFKHFLMVYFD